MKICPDKTQKRSDDIEAEQPEHESEGKQASGSENSGSPDGGSVFFLTCMSAKKKKKAEFNTRKIRSGRIGWMSDPETED